MDAVIAECKKSVLDSEEDIVKLKVVLEALDINKFIGECANIDELKKKLIDNTKLIFTTHLPNAQKAIAAVRKLYKSMVKNKEAEERKLGDAVKHSFDDVTHT